MQLATGYACSLNDMLARFPYEKCKSLTGNKQERQRKVKKVFKESIKYVLDDIIDNNATFQLPSMGCSKGEIHMKEIQGEDFKTARKNGKFKDIDFLESLFTGYQLHLYLKGKRDTIFPKNVKPIYVNRYYKDKITENTNSGKAYSG